MYWGATKPPAQSCARPKHFCGLADDPKKSQTQGKDERTNLSNAMKKIDKKHV